jgi:hypothetical protein
MGHIIASAACPAYTEDCVSNQGLRRTRVPPLQASMRRSGASVPSRFLVYMLAAIPSIGAFAGGWLDERSHLGFTNWRSACRATGLSPRSLLQFTQELLPTAIIGVLSGGLILLSLGFLMRSRRDLAGACTAAHLGCALAMPLGVILCTLSMPVAAMLAVDVALAAGVAALALRWFARRANGVATHP